MSKNTLPPLVGNLDERLLIQAQRNRITFVRNAKMIQRNQRFLKWFGWFDQFTGGSLRHENEQLIKADLKLHEANCEIEVEIDRRGLK